MENLRFYEVVLDNCDGQRATVHVWTDGSYSSDATPAKVRRMMRKYWRNSSEEYEAPMFVKKWAGNMLSHGRRVRFVG